MVNRYTVIYKPPLKEIDGFTALHFNTQNEVKEFINNNPLPIWPGTDRHQSSIEVINNYLRCNETERFI